MKLVTIEYLDEHRTERGAWTYAQVAALGVKWPPPPGWRQALVCTSISDEQAARFEAGKAVFTAKTLKRRKQAEVDLLRAMGREVPPELLPPPPTPREEVKAWAKPSKNARRKLRKEARWQAALERLGAKVVAVKVAPAPVPVAKKAPASVVPRPPKIKTSGGAVYVAGIDVCTPEFLKTYEWATLRTRAFARYGNVCVCCGASPATGAVMNMDHIKPRKLFPHLALEIENLQPMCNTCNRGKGNWDQTDWRPEEYDAEQVSHLRLIAKGTA